MQKIIGIILLAIFITAQGDRYAAYMECRFVKAIAGAGRCDCEKLLVAVAVHQPVSPAVHQHAHIDELYYPTLLMIGDVIKDGAVLMHGGCFYLAKGVIHKPEHPPAIACL